MPDPSTVLLIGAGGLVDRHLRRALAGTRTIPTFHRDETQTGLQLDITDHEAVRRTIRETKPDVSSRAAVRAMGRAVPDRRTTAVMSAARTRPQDPATYDVKNDNVGFSTRE